MEHQNVNGLCLGFPRAKRASLVRQFAVRNPLPSDSFPASLGKSPHGTQSNLQARNRNIAIIPNHRLRGQIQHVVFGLIYLKYISDTFDEYHAKLVEGKGDYAGVNPEGQDKYKPENVFWVHPAARWAYLQCRAKLPTTGKIIDDAMEAL